MSDQEINIAIAEACPTIVGLGADGIYYLRTGLVEFDPCNDLNAMHEALMMQTSELRIRFRKELKHIIAPETKPSKIKVSGICLMGEAEYDLWFHATARQRAEAFLRTIGKWKEEK